MVHHQHSMTRPPRQLLSQLRYHICTGGLAHGQKEPRQSVLPTRKNLTVVVVNEGGQWSETRENFTNNHVITSTDMTIKQPINLIYCNYDDNNRPIRRDNQENIRPPFDTVYHHMAPIQGCCVPEKHLLRQNFFWNQARATHDGMMDNGRRYCI